MVKPIPDDWSRVSVALSCNGAAAAIEFYVSIFGATERRRIDMGDKVGHSELVIGDSVVMVADEFPEMDFASPETIGGTPCTLSVYVEDVDATFAAAIAAGATQLRPVEDQFYGDRSGQFKDPWGHRWNVATHIEDISDEELTRRAAQMMSNQAA